jgi:DNA-binding response OmpR family regulator
MAGESILVLEDNREIRLYIRTVLEEHGFQVIEAFTGWQALQLAENTPPDVLLLDWQLPDISGLDVLRALRTGNIQAPAILMTAYGSGELAMIALRLGARDYLQKPFSGEDLIKAVDEALTEVRLRRERESLMAQIKQSAEQLDTYPRRLQHARESLIRLARLIDEWEHKPTEHLQAQFGQARQYIREIAELLRESSPAAN